MFRSLLVANRGEIAVRIIRTARSMGIRTVAVYSEADADALHVREADGAALLGPAPVQQSYLDIERIMKAAHAQGVEAIHPGYGLLSENAGFARAVSDSGITFVGPSSEAIDAMGDKSSARRLVARHGVPVARGTENPPHTVSEALEAAKQVGFPLMLKAAAGGGGIGMSAVESAEELGRAFDAARARAERMFGVPDLLLEQLVRPARHVEVQIMGLNDGRVIALGERDCSVQRRFQKVVEETPAQWLGDQTREHLLAAAVRAGKSVDYRGAGTVEFLVDPIIGTFTFLEMNTRLQVEHPVTEMVTGLDIVELQLRIAAGEQVKLQAGKPQGHAIEFRLYAEDPVRFLPAPGRIDTWTLPGHDWFRVDTGYGAGSEVSRYYDPLIAKLCVHGDDRPAALARAQQVLSEIAVGPVTTNLPLLKAVAEHPRFCQDMHDTRLLMTDELSVAGRS